MFVLCPVRVNPASALWPHPRKAIENPGSLVPNDLPRPSVGIEDEDDWIADQDLAMARG
jgi:hypothetical protein